MKLSLQGVVEQGSLSTRFHIIVVNWRLVIYRCFFNGFEFKVVVFPSSLVSQVYTAIPFYLSSRRGIGFLPFLMALVWK